MKRIIIGIIIGVVIALVVVEGFRIYKDLDKKMEANVNVEQKKSNVEDKTIVNQDEATVEDSIITISETYDSAEIGNDYYIINTKSKELRSNISTSSGWGQPHENKEIVTKISSDKIKEILTIIEQQKNVENSKVGFGDFEINYKNKKYIISDENQKKIIRECLKND